MMALLELQVAEIERQILSNGPLPRDWVIISAPPHGVKFKRRGQPDSPAVDNHPLSVMAERAQIDDSPPTLEHYGRRRGILWPLKYSAEVWRWQHHHTVQYAVAHSMAACRLHVCSSMGVDANHALNLFVDEIVDAKQPILANQFYRRRVSS